MNRSYRLRCIALAVSIAVCATGCRTPRDFSDPTADDPGSQLARLLRGWQSVRAGGENCADARSLDTPLVDCERLRKQIERLSIEFGNHPEVLLANAVVAFESGRREESEKDLDLLRRIAPQNVEAALLRARIALEDGNLRLSRRILEEQVALVPDRAVLYELLASVAFLESRWEEARRALDVASRLGGTAWRIAYHRGLVAEAEGRPAEAADAYRICLDLASEFAPARARLRALAATEGPG